MPSAECFFFTDHQIRSATNIGRLITEIRAAFARDFHASLQMPVRTHLEMGTSVLLLMPCHDTALQAAGVKIVTVSPQSGVNATYTLLDPVNGRTLAVMEANYLTDVRTAATSAVATDILARPDAQTLGIFGSGRQATAHLAVLPCVRRFRRYLVCGSGRTDLKDFCRVMKQEHRLEIEAVDAETCARESDVLCTCTTSPRPVLDGRKLKSGAHLNLVGAFQPHTREVDDAAVKRARIFVDTYDGALAEAGDLLIPLEKGIIERGNIVADLHEVVSGKKGGRTSPEEVTLFKSVGCALEDLVAATAIWKNQP
jgi:ornithine cyclodeaminase/alanine dehydrogenase-like protein (mu-crystallin family)